MSHQNPPPAAGYLRVFENPSGGCVDVHELHGKQEMRENLVVALWLAARGERVCLLPVSTTQGVKSPDATRDGVTWEFKIPEGRTENAIDKALRDGIRQAPRILLKLPVDFRRDLLEDGIYNRTQRTSAIAQLAVLLGDKLYVFNRKAVVDNTFRGVMQ